MTMIEFLLARIAEEEGMAGLTHDFQCSETLCPECSAGPYPCNCGTPARRLAECEARRRIVKFAQLQEEMYAYRPSDFQQGVTGGVFEAVRYLAATHADHPDYDPAWK